MTIAEIRLAAADLLESRFDAWYQGLDSVKLPNGNFAYFAYDACWV